MFLGKLLKDRIKLYTKEDLKGFAYDIGLTSLSRLRKDALVDAIVALACTGKVDTVYRQSLMKRRVAQLLNLHKSLAKKSK